MNILFIAYFRIGYIGLLYSAIIGNVLSSVVVFAMLKIHRYISIKKYNKQLMKDMIRYSIPLVPNSISWTVINFSDRMVISSMLGTSFNGIYSVSYKISSVMDNVYGFFYTAWKESAAKALKDDNKSEFYNEIYDLLQRVLYAVVTGLTATLPFIFGLLIKNDFVEAYLYIPILLIATYFSNISGFYGGIFAAYKDTKVMGVTTIISAVVNLILCLIFINTIGLWAAALSTLASTFMVYYLRKRKLKEFITLKEHNLFLPAIVMLFSLSCFYINNLVINIFSLLVVAVYNIAINKNIIKNVVNTIKNKQK